MHQERPALPIRTGLIHFGAIVASYILWFAFESSLWKRSQYQDFFSGETGRSWQKNAAP
jgi:hypothetical protein